MDFVNVNVPAKREVRSWDNSDWSEGAGLIVRAISFQDFQHVVLIHQRYRQTDCRQMDMWWTAPLQISIP